MGDLALPLLDPPIEAACTIFIILSEMSAVLHHSRFISVPFDTWHLHPFGGRDDHETGAG
jgi:hypothetical protein